MVGTQENLDNLHSLEWVVEKLDKDMEGSTQKVMEKVDIQGHSDKLHSLLWVVD